MLFHSRIVDRRIFAIAVFSSLCATASCPAGLTHYYPFSGNAADAVGGADGTLINEAAVGGGVLHLDGVNDYVQFGEKIVPTSGSYSVAMFARQTSPQGGYGELISQGFSGGPGFYIGHDPGGAIRASDAWLSTGVPFPSDGEFHHLALTVDAAGGVSKLYVDGSLSATLNAAISTTGGGTDSRLGRQFAPYDEFFAGALDDVRIYDNALSARQVAGLAVPEPTAIVPAGLAAAWALVASRRAAMPGRVRCAARRAGRPAATLG